MYVLITDPKNYQEQLNNEDCICENVKDALETISRTEFVPEELDLTNENSILLSSRALETVEIPIPVARMLAYLDVHEGNKILDVGVGAGWTTALLAKLTGKTGHVYGVEPSPELADLARYNNSKAGFSEENVTIHGDICSVCAIFSFDRIFFSTLIVEDVDCMIRQLNNNGKLVMPLYGEILVVSKDAGGRVTRTQKSLTF